MDFVSLHEEQCMEINNLRAGAKLWLEDGSVVEVLAPSLDGQSVRVRYLESPFDRALIGVESDCTDYEIVSYVGDGDEADSAAPIR